jgi:hypothetical protein
MVRAIFQAVWNHVVTHKEDLVWALLFAIIADSFRVGSFVRGGVRRMENKWSELSASRLQERISELEKRRDYYVSYMTSDKALYLFTLRIVFVILLGVSTGAAVSVLGRFPLVRAYFPMTSDVYAFLFFAVGILGAWQGIRVTDFGTRSKLSEMIAKLDGEIAGLKSKLQERTEPGAKV